MRAPEKFANVVHAQSVTCRFETDLGLLRGSKLQFVLVCLFLGALRRAFLCEMLWTSPCEARPVMK